MVIENIIRRLREWRADYRERHAKVPPVLLVDQMRQAGWDEKPCK